VPRSDTQFKPVGDGLDEKPICCRFDQATSALLRAMPDRSVFIREAVRVALKGGAALVALVVSQSAAAAAPQPRMPGVVMIRDCIHTPFKPQGEGQLVSTYSCANSDVVGYSIAVDCPRQLVNLHAPGGPLGVDDAYRWHGWDKPVDAHQQAAMDVACAPLFKTAKQ
jgi:hypothetical protein